MEERLYGRSLGYFFFHFSKRRRTHLMHFTSEKEVLVHTTNYVVYYIMYIRMDEKNNNSLCFIHTIKNESIVC